MTGVNLSSLQAFAHLQFGRPLAPFWPLMISPEFPGLLPVHNLGQGNKLFQDSSAQVFYAC